MPVSPALDTVGPIEVRIDVDGTAVDGSTLVAVEIEHGLNRIGRAQLIFDDGDAAFDGRFPLSDGNTFDVGKTVTVRAAYGSTEPETLFEGVVVAQRLRFESGGEVRFTVECRHAAVRMTLVRRNRIKRDVTDRDLLVELFRDAGLQADVASTEVTLGEIVQHDVVDWDFAVTRAEANALVVIADLGDVRVASPDLSGEPPLAVTYGMDLIRFDAVQEGRDQHPSARAVTWSPAEQATTDGTASILGLGESGPGDVSPSQLASALDQAPWLLQTAALDPASLEPWAKGYQQRAALARNRARLVFPGSALARIGTTIELKDVGRRYGGKALIGTVEHRLEAGEWLTTVETGVDPVTHAQTHRLPSPEAAGLVAPMRGLQIGVVQKLEDDPDGQHRIQVALPLLGQEQGIWARLAKAYASDGFGLFVLPEIGDEVVLGFFNDDPSQAVVLASLYSSKRAPPFTLEDANDTKALVTRSDLRVILDEAKKVITVKTPAGNQAVLDDEAKTITLEDETGNVVELSPSGIKLESPRDVTIKATGKVDVTAGADLTAKGRNVNAEGDVGVKAKGGATAELSAGGQTTVKGGIVMIN